MTRTSNRQTTAPLRVSQALLRSIKPEELITYRVAMLSHLIGQIVERSVSQPLDLTSRQWRVMMLLNRFGPSTSGQIAANSPLDHSQVSRVSYELADKGLITMRADPHDRRKQTLALTPAGIDLLRQGLVESLKRQQRFRDCLAEQEYAALNRALDALTIEARRMLAEDGSID
ncbi:MAG: MarR family winged helix-turn-helix transcriptional regulator [Rubrivivax sp.]